MTPKDAAVVLLKTIGWVVREMFWPAPQRAFVPWLFVVAGSAFLVYLIATLGWRF